LDLDQEDSVSLESSRTTAEDSWQASTDPARPLRVAVISLPYFSNFTDFDALVGEPSVCLRFPKHSRYLDHADVIVIPGTKNTISDLRWLKTSGMGDQVVAHARSGRVVIGICGGMQMMGVSISDPHHLEGGGQMEGLSLLPIRTVLKQEKTTVPVTAYL